MRTDEERIAAMHRRAAQLKEKNNKRQTYLAGALSAAASLALIMIFALRIYGIRGGLATGYTGTGMSGSILSSGGATGYAVIAIAAFFLGSCITVFCFKLRNRKDSNKNKDGK